MNKTEATYTLKWIIKSYEIYHRCFGSENPDDPSENRKKAFEALDVLNQEQENRDKEDELWDICKKKRYCLNIHYCRSGDVKVRIEQPDENGFIKYDIEHLIMERYGKNKHDVVDKALATLQGKERSKG